MNIKESSIWRGVTDNLPEVALKSMVTGAVASRVVHDRPEYGRFVNLTGVSAASVGIGLVDYYLLKRARNIILNLPGEKRLVDQTMSALIALDPIASTAILNYSIMSPIEKGAAFFGLALANALVLGALKRIAEIQDARKVRSPRQ